MYTLHIFFGWASNFLLFGFSVLGSFLGDCLSNHSWVKPGTTLMHDYLGDRLDVCPLKC